MIKYYHLACGCKIITQPDSELASIEYCNEHRSMRKTKKQVISGYHRPVCTKCNRELRPETNGVGVLDTVEGRPYELFDADLWKCPGCDMEVVGGFAHGPIASHFEDNFKPMIDGYAKKNKLIKNRG